MGTNVTWPRCENLCGRLGLRVTQSASKLQKGSDSLSTLNENS